MRVVEASSLGARRTLNETRYPIRLGESFDTGVISAETIDRVAGAFEEIVTICRSFGVTHTRAVATSAIREASNGRQFVYEISKRSGIDVEVISGREEARLIAVGLRPDMVAGRHNLVIDIGGGSTELIYTRPTLAFASVRSVRLGAVRLHQREKYGTRVSSGCFKNLQRLITETFEEANLPVSARDTRVVGVGGTVRALLDARHQGEREYRSVLTRAELDSLLSSLVGLSPAEMEEQFGIEKRRGQIIIPGGLILLELLNLYDLEEINVSSRGLRDGLLEELLESALGWVSVQHPVAEFVRVGQKYEVDSAHAAHVAMLATKMFDSLYELHGLDEYWRETLAAACYMHDIGQYVSYSRHHKHSYYLILNEDVPGMTPLQQQCAALIARYHRKSFPAEKHIEYMSVPPPARDGVLKCAAILRIADALDRQHRQLVADLSAEEKDTEVTISISSVGPVLLELSALPKKSEMFEEVFGLRIIMDVTGTPKKKAVQGE